MKRIFIFFLPVIWFTSCEKKTETLFESVTSSHSNIDFINHLDNNKELNILTYLYYYNGAGVAAADFNNDNLIDVYFTSNQGADQLYLNKGEFVFEETTKASGIQNSDGWTTGVTHVDINNDGLLDIYVCKVSGHKNLKGHNLLFINQGIDKKGVPKFLEQSKEYNLDFSGLSTQAAFFDYDNDGDLDMFLLNHSVYPNRNYGNGSLRNRYHPKFGDVLFQNQNGIFVDVSEASGIFQGRIGYGLGVSTSDLNNDGFTDIYVGNDFFENDYVYYNQGNGTFKEVVSSNLNTLGHTSHFSMGNDIADLNNDGWTDIVSTDMLPEDLTTYKTSGLEYGYPIYRQYLNKGYAPQFMQNTLHLNNQGKHFSEIAYLSGISASEWSWAPLIADFNNDGNKDIYITNGIVGATNDMDYMNFIANEDIQKRIDNGMDSADLPLIKEIPEKKVSNYFFSNQGNLSFQNKSSQWSPTAASFSNGATYADLDNDGDLDLIVNNINEKAFLLKNNSSSRNYLKLNFKGPTKNTMGIGTKVIAHLGDQKIVNENYSTRGYLSAVPNLVHLGLGNDSIIDSLSIIWPGGMKQLMKNIEANQELTINYDKAIDSIQFKSQKENSLIALNDTLIPFKHEENVSIDFDREPLIPFASSNNGPDIDIADINNDGLDDVVVCGAKNQASEVFLQEESGRFKSYQSELFETEKLNEDTACLFVDVDGDNFKDLLIASGGNEFLKGKAIQPRLYRNRNGVFNLDSNQFKNIFSNVSSLTPIDLENDGDMDIILTSDRVTGLFGETPKQYIFQNDGVGNFQDITVEYAPQFEYAGNITDIAVFDYDNNGYDDFIAVGHWMAPTLFLNNGSGIRKISIAGFEGNEGLWNSITVNDFDNDGDLDVVCGNWGLNSKLSTSPEKPLQLYLNDFDNNGSSESLVTYFQNGIETPFASKDELVKQLPYLNKQFLSYSSFANASIQELFSKEKLDKAKQKKCFELASCYFENNGENNFIKRHLPRLAQVSSVFEIVPHDFNQDGAMDVLLAGNQFEISTQLGRMDANKGLILLNDSEGILNDEKNIQLGVLKAVRGIKPIKINNQNHFLIATNDGHLQLAKMNSDL
ncbi:VCBS repeat-containing protein [Croceivirga thetidis]|uniref:VCBS repeat-containing protein n=1 Tax=Croceivirga thetidis TaxID=2721623 RepID=A0ABX1GPL8_9FLAO|nr:VCBS repeat-containing protein [Croceivirga thetidis]NKI31623.1 VCBS repeat-containing protein [Croceivirga thetidis]